jgi:hypothetical protein
MAEELNEALLEGIHVDKWSPGAWANTQGEDEEWQPDVEPPHITDYAAFKKHKHYGQYFKPYRYRPFPAWMYHKSEEPKLVKSKDEVIALGPEWSPVPPAIKRIDMTGKASPAKSETQRLAEVVAQSLSAKTQGAGSIDATAIAAVVAAVMAALPQNQPAAPVAAVPDEASENEARVAVETLAPEDPHAALERKALFELAETNNVKIDKRWSNARIKTELGL